MIDLQAVDAKLPANLADVLKANNGDRDPLWLLHYSAKGQRAALRYARP